VKVQISGDARFMSIMRNLTDLESSNGNTRRKIGKEACARLFACKKFNDRQGENESTASCGNKIDPEQAVRRVCKREEILLATGLTYHPGKA
jgi:hypothetical protein